MKKQKEHYIQSFDGIRTIALLGVIFYHITSKIKGGYFGVITFFVLAGFLTLKKASLNDKKFNIKILLKSIFAKIKKLYPPMIFMIFIVSLITIVFFRHDFASFAPEIKGAVLSLNNYFQIFSGKSYFDNMGTLAPFTHLWALSLEMQVYIIFFILFSGKYNKTKRDVWFMILLIISISSYSASLIMINNECSLTRVYYGLFTRLYAFSMGGAAFIICDIIQSKSSYKSEYSIVRDVLSLVLLVLSIVTFFFFEPREDVFKYIFPGYSLLISMLLIFQNFRKSFVGKFLSLGFFQTLSKKSYFYYLWHFPIIEVQKKFFATTKISNLKFYIIYIIIMIIISEFSYYLNILFTKKNKFNKLGVLNIWTFVFTLVISIGLLFIPYKAIGESANNAGALTEMQNIIKANEEAQKSQNKRLNQNGQSNESKIDMSNKLNFVPEPNLFDQKADIFPVYPREAEAIETLCVINKDLPEIYINPKEYRKYRGVNILLVGDSVSLGSYDELSKYMPNGVYDSAVSRSSITAYDIYKKYDTQKPRSYVVIALANNNYLNTDNLDRIMAEFNNEILILVSVALPNIPFETDSNNATFEYAREHKNVYVADWYSIAKGKAEYFAPDSIHPSMYGRKIYAQLICKTILDIEKTKEANHK